ncbi:GntR family transcriptional regulator [Paenibacillus sp.]|uniref:GntR family transcriptional regulator n=1 Tax=Paenibacillus sp. TaxID=58172 RepID=UPI002D4C9B3F|nr:GntR family transcriptional regulator [Paenibacillus sp.]HZG55297.1 GntR family transcriptional regulator [Paenibacillus sp.]
MEEGNKGSTNPLLKEVAYEKIKELILEEHFEPGRFLSERELIALLAMSKTPIKAALTRLESEGFLTVASKHGIFINDLTLQRIMDIYDLRTVLEVYNCESVLGKLVDAQFARLEQNLRETEGIVERLDIRAFAKADHEFHLAICEFAGNQEVYRVLLNYHDHLLRITLRHLKKDPHRMKQFYRDHLDIFEALKRGSADAVERMREHLQNSKRKLFA